jgi:MFS superfamily sulfate permease-like transporter
MARNDASEPATGLQGMIQNWRADLVAAFSVALVALPLGLGIAIASDVPPMAGVLSAIIGGIVTTLVRSSHMAVNGPAAGLIVVVLGAMEALRDPDGTALPYVLAAIVVAGAFQVLFGLLRAGALANFFPGSVIHGMLAAIGVIIAAKQIHVAVGHRSQGHAAIEDILSIPGSIQECNLPVAVIAICSLAVLLIHPRVKNKTFHYIPAPVMVLAVAVPFVYFFNFFEVHDVHAVGRVFEIGPRFLIDVPDKIQDTIMFPNFSKIGQVPFWLSVMSITLVASIETLLSTKAVEKLDPYHRPTDLNKDLAAVGLSTMVSGMLGGLPIITVIVRSSVNVNHGGKTRWSNFYHGWILLALVLIFPNFIETVPQAALAAILIFTGYKLASPKIFRDAHLHGTEQLIFLAATLIATLYTGLLKGIMIGAVAVVVGHWFIARISPVTFLKECFLPEIQIEEHEGKRYMKFRGILNFISLLRLDRQLKKIPTDLEVVLDLAHCTLVDATSMEYLHHLEGQRKLETVGLDLHQPSSGHPNALRYLVSHVQGRKTRLTARQKRLNELAESREWKYAPNIDWRPSKLSVFEFFQTRPIEYRSNIIAGGYPDLDVKWWVEDVTFDEGAIIASEEHHVTFQLLEVPLALPSLSMEKEGMVDKILMKAGVFSEIEFPDHPQFHNEFLVQAEDEEAAREFLTDDLIRFFEEEEVYHLEFRDNAIFAFKYDRLSSHREITTMIHFTQNLLKLILKTDSPKEDEEASESS